MEYNFFDEYFDICFEKIENVFDIDKNKLDKIQIEKELLENILSEIKKILWKISSRCLLLEFQVFNKVNRMNENSIEENMKYYKKVLRENKDYCKSIFQIYPGMELICKNMVKKQMLFVMDVLRKFEEEREEICDIFFQRKKEIKIEEIHLGSGDMHCGGKAVVEIRLEEGESIFYKPRSLMSEKIFGEIFTQIEGNSKNYADKYQNINRTQYGWIKGIQQHECYSEKEIRQFYKRIGIIAGISYLLGIHDLHYQNMIAYGEYPFLVDLENFFITDESTFQIGESLSHIYTVLSSGLFPISLRESRYCAVTGGDGGESLYQVPILKLNDAGIFVTYGKPELKRGTNLPGSNINVLCYFRDIKKGFNLAYSYIMHMDEKELLKMIPDDLESRYLLHSTQLYYNILEASYHPSLLMSEGERRKFIQRICPKGKVREYEIEDLVEGDIPYFYRKANSRSLFTSSGREVKDFFKETVFEAIKRRKRAMNTEDRKVQCELLKWSLKVSRLKESDFENNIYCVTENDDGDIEWLELAIKMAEKIKDEAIWYDNNKKVAWMILNYPVNQKMDAQLGICDFYLYEGLSGIILFMKAMQVITGKYKKIISVSENELFEYTDSVLEGRRKTISNYTGIYCGEASIMCTYLSLFQMTEEQKYLTYATKHAEIVKSLVTEDKSVDILYGNAGAIIAFCSLSELTKNNKYLKYAIEAEKYLRPCLQQNGDAIFFNGKKMGNPCTGIAHGNSGVILAYGRLLQHIESVDYNRILKGLLLYENKLFRRRFNGSKETERKLSNLPSWCHGDIGILFAYLQLERMTGHKYDHETEVVLKQTKKILESVVIRTSMSLCHGNLGNLLLMKECVKLSHMGTEATKQFEKKLRKVLGSKGLLLPVEQLNYGFMRGIAGIGYACLQMDHISKKVKLK